MLANNLSYDDAENINLSLGNIEEDQQNYSSDNNEELNDQDDNPLTQSSDDDNDGDDKTSATNVADKNKNVASSYHDNSRINSRPNEANDRLDSGSGGLSAGGNKSATD